MSQRKPCTFPDCGRPSHGRGLCPGHYRQYLFGKELQPLRRRRLKGEVRLCEIPDCGGVHAAKGLCQRHYLRTLTRKASGKRTRRRRHSPRPKLSPLERLAERVVIGAIPPHLTTPCWVWTGSVKGGGYGAISIDGRGWATHRLAHFLATGEEPLVVRHHCDNPPCVNPDHLAGGDFRDNAADRQRRGRGNAAKGERAGKAKLTQAQVDAIRADDRPLGEIAAQYGVSKSNICLIRTGKTWKR